MRLVRHGLSSPQGASHAIDQRGNPGHRHRDFPDSRGFGGAFAPLSTLPWLVPTVIGTYLVQQGATRLVGDITGTLLAGIALGTLAGIASRPAGRPPRLVLLLGGFFVLTVGGLGLRGATALLGDDVGSGFGDLRDFLVQMPSVAISLAIGLLATERMPSTTRRVHPSAPPTVPGGPGSPR